MAVSVVKTERSLPLFCWEIALALLMALTWKTMGLQPKIALIKALRFCWEIALSLVSGFDGQWSIKRDI